MMIIVIIIKIIIKIVIIIIIDKIYRYGYIIRKSRDAPLRFALGVSVFAMAVQDYPWTSTKKSSCQLFEYISTPLREKG